MMGRFRVKLITRPTVTTHKDIEKHFSAKGEQEYVKDFIAGKSWTVEKSAFQNVKEIDQSLVMEHQVNAQEQATVAGDMMYINPFVDLQVKENLFKLEKT
jgi:hypothetical protein